MNFKNHYNQIGKKKDFKTKYNAEDETDQSQIASASIVEMAKRYGIDAIIAKAEQKNIEANSSLANQLYGHDFTNMFNSKEEMLNVKKKLNNLFENIPARIRKEIFKDNPMEFINAYATNDEKKLGKLAEIGIVSQSQLEDVKQYNIQKNKERIETETRKAFITELEKKTGALYEEFKTNGNININVNKNDAINNPSISPSVQ